MKSFSLSPDSARFSDTQGSTRAALRARPTVEPIEPKLLYSADLHPAAVVWTPEAQVRLVNEADPSDSSQADTATQATKELVIVDSRVPDLDTLLQDFARVEGRDLEVVVLDAQRDGLQQITQALAEHSDLNAVHLIAHGEAGAMDLGASHLDAESLADHADAAATWGRALSADGDILLYGCNIAAGETGANFIAQLSAITGADVAASVDLTGAAATGGNWTLEATTGRIDARLAVSDPAQARWQGTLALTPVGGQTLVNTGYTSGNQYVGGMSPDSPAPHSIAMDASGNYVVVWTSDAGEDGDGFSVLAQRYNASGVAQGSAFIVNTASFDDQKRAQVVMNASGQFAVVWEEDLGADSNILIRMFDADGTARGVAFEVDGATGAQDDPTAVMDSAGNVAVFWTRNDASGQGIFGKYITAAGGQPHGLFQVNTTTAGDQTYASASIGANGDVVVAWEDSMGPSGSTAVFAQRFVMTGSGIDVVGSEFWVDHRVGSDQGRPSVAVDGNGNFAIAWQDANGALPLIQVIRYDSSGTAVNSFGVTPFDGDLRHMPTIALRQDGGLVVSWVGAGGLDGAGDGVYIRQYDPNGDAATAAILVNTDTGGHQQTPSVALAPNGNVVVVWQGFVTGDAWGIGMQRYAASFSPDTPPVITSNGGGASASITVRENESSAVTIVTATDAESSNLNYELSGPDGALFEINLNTYALHFITPPDFEAPTDANSDNVYQVTVTVFDGVTSTSQNLSITVTDGYADRVGSETRVNTVTAGTQFSYYTGSVSGTQSIGMDAAGNSVAVFISDDGDNYGIYGQRFDASGSPIGGNFLINTVTANDQLRPKVIMNAAGAFAVVWDQYNATLGEYDVFARIYDASGTAQGIEFLVNSTVSNASFPAGAMDANGNLILVWISEADDGDGQGIIGRRFDASGTPLGAEFVVNASATTGEQSAPVIAMDGSGNFVVVWQDDFTRESGNIGLYGQRFDASGVAQGSDFRVGSLTGDDREAASISMDAVGNFVVVWQDHRGGGDSQIYGQRFDASGNTLGGEFVVNPPVSDRDTYSSRPVVSMRPSGSFFVAWEMSDYPGSGIYMRGYAADGTALGNEMPVNIPNAGQNNPSIAFQDNGSVIVLWDGSGTGDAQGVFLQRYVTDAMNYAPVITSGGGGASANLTMAENAVTPVTIVTATDSDLPAQTLTYSIVGGLDASLFSINSASGQLNFLTPLNFESPADSDSDNVYQVIVQVADGHGGIDTQTINVTAIDMNDAPAITSNGGGASANLNVTENTTAVTTVTASDPDVAPTLTYSIAGGTDAGRFTINASTGEVSFAVAPDYESPNDSNTDNVYQVIVQVADGNGGTDTQTLSITVTDANDAPVITSNSGGATASTSVSENTTLVTFVTATDSDLPAQTLTYSISGGTDSARFVINSSTGRLSFNTTPNFESPADSDTDNVYQVIVRVADGNGGIDTQTITVTVTNLNESPVITSNGAGGTASINVNEGTTAVTTVTATDPDAPAQTLTYLISGGNDASRFSINASTGVLTFLVAPNFEAPSDSNGDNVYDVIVQVWDGGAGDSQSITVTVLDANDAPAITSDGGGASANVNVAEGTVAVTTVVAADADVPAQSLTYSITGGTDAGRFTINASTGALAFAVAPDFDAPVDSNGDNIYQVIVQAGDGNGGIDAQTVNVTVTSINEAPAITSNGGGATASLSVAENTTAVTTVTAADADLPAQTLNYAITGGTDAGRFTINASTGVLAFATAPDFDTPVDSNGDNIYQVIVQVDDGNGGIDTQTINVTVTNVNESPAITSNGGGATASVSVAENTTAVTTVTADDPDTAPSLTYSITGGTDAGRFTINASTGALSFAVAPNFEAPTDSNVDNVYQVTVQVADGNGGFDTQTLSVSVTNVNESPAITSNGGGATASVNVAENTTAITTVAATDPDAAPTFTYSITGGLDAARFTINASTGVLAFAAAPNFETPSDSNTDNTYQVTVRVADGNGGVDIQTLNVSVTNANEAPAITSNGAGATASVNVAENTTAVTTVTATDPDAAPALTYSISGGLDAVRFTINASTGVLAFAVAPNFEAPRDSNTNNVYQVTVRVADGSGGFDTQTLNVSVTNANDAPTITSNGGGASANVNVVENTTAVTTVAATDPDNSQALTYSITGGLDAARFTINASTGVLAFAVAPNFEAPSDSNADNTYQLTVQVADGNGGFDTQTLNISVTNTNDAPTITSNGGGASAHIDVIENNTAVTTVTAADTDTAQTLTYSITGGTDASRFTINASTGALAFAVAPDFEAPADSNADNAYQVIVQASDSSGGIDTQTLAISVAPVNHAPVITSNAGGPSATLPVAENATAVTTVTAADIDVPAQTLTYSITGGTDAARFAIDASTGALAFVAAANFEAPSDANGDNIYQVIVQAADGHGGTASQSILVLVTDINESPAITSNGGSMSANVLLPARMLSVTTVVAIDVDRPAQTLTYSIAGGADAASFVIDPSTGALSFVSAPDGNTHTDANTDGIYQVVVAASDGQGGSSTQSLFIGVRSAPLAVTGGGTSNANNGSSGNTTTTPVVVVVAPQEKPASTGSSETGHTPPSTQTPTVVSDPDGSTQAPPEAVTPEPGERSLRPVSETQRMSMGLSGPAAQGSIYMSPLRPAALRHGAEISPIAIERLPTSLDLSLSEVKFTVPAEKSLPINNVIVQSYSSGSRHSGPSLSARNDVPEQDASEDELLSGVPGLAQVGGIAAALGTAWWAMRASGILIGLIASTPTWRNFDPLPVLGGRSGDDDDDDHAKPRRKRADHFERLRDEIAAGALLDGK